MQVMFNRSNVMKTAHANTRHQLRFPSRLHPTYAKAFAKHLKQAILNERNRVACELFKIEQAKNPITETILTGVEAEFFSLNMKDNWTPFDRNEMQRLKSLAA